MKTCKKCRKEKPDWDFDYDRHTKDRLTAACTACSKEVRFPISTKKRKKRNG